MSKLPISKVVLPAALVGVSNGKLDTATLETCNIPNVKLQATAARAWRALNAAAIAKGFKLRSTGAYRSYDAQVTLFLSRYVTNELSGRPTKTWNGKKYWQKPNTAMAATPGTSNHGLGLAIDLAEQNDGDKRVKFVSPMLVLWLCNNAHLYGISAEDNSEVWHWRYHAGDAIPAAVLEYENGPKAPSETPQTLVEPPKAPKVSLRRGSKGEAVKRLQRRLVLEGFAVRGGIDGIYGKYTEGAVKRYQKRKGLVADGVAGPVTLGRLGL